MYKWAILLCVCWLSVSSSASSFRSDWDRDFKQAAETWLPGIDWRLLKAQCFQESSLRPRVTSPVGAYGLCQFMPGTAGEVAPRINATPEQFWLPEVSIRAAGYYMAQLHRTWRAPRPLMDRHLLAMASYNAGAGHLITAQRRCGGKNLYAEIIPCLPSVTGRHSEETIGYVRNIVTRWWPQMLLE